MYYLRQFLEALLYPLRALLSSPGGIATGARRLAAISLPARISIIVFVLLVAATAVGYFVAYDNATLASFRKLWYFTWLLVGLIVVIPVLLYYVLRLWLEGDVSRYPDIDYAWKAGLAELAAHGLDLNYTPLFLVLGSAGDAFEHDLFEAAQLPLRVKEVPTGASALHWYAEPNGVYLVCSQVGCLSKMAEVAKRSADEYRGRPARTIPGAGPAATVDIRGTMTEGQLDVAQTQSVAEDAPPPESSEAPAAEPPRKARPSIVASQLFPPQPVPATRDIRGTIALSQDEDSVMAAPEFHHASVSPDDQREQELRLEYLCRLIRKARDPLAPVNGVMTLLPYSSVERGGREGSALQQVLHRDLEALVRTLKVRCPVVSLVVGLEEESGFRELLRRLPRDVAIRQRFGKGYSVGNAPIPEQLEAVVTHACGLFEAKVYELFREKGALAKPGNRKLYALLCKIRRQVRVPLTNVIVYGYAYDPDVKKNSEPDPLYYSGCYFAAAGGSDDRRAFVKCVFEKLPEQQEDLEWTEAALADEERYRGWSQAAAWIDGLLLLALLGLVVVYFFWR